MAWDSLLRPDGAPLGVSNRAWDGARTFRAAGCVVLLIGAATTVMGVLGLVSGVLDDDSDVVTLAAATTHQGPARVSGRLESAAPLQMPDDGTPVVRGRLRVSARTTAGSKNGAPGELVFVDWTEVAPDAYLTDGTHRLPIVNAAIIEATIDRRARAQVEHQAGRNGRPLAVKYGDERYPVQIEDHTTSLHADVERELVPHGETVVLTGVLQGGTLHASSGGVIRRSVGAVEEVAGNARKTSFAFACCGPFALIMGLGVAIAGTIRLRKMRAMGAAGLLKKLL
ncbi:MAG: hypothetical protein JRH11_01030 [Deltaproteobacteria bacterium]|nr:hypothetical protein [Deltaproteobacteria bacterium]